MKSCCTWMSTGSVVGPAALPAPPVATVELVALHVLQCVLCPATGATGNLRPASGVVRCDTIEVPCLPIAYLAFLSVFSSCYVHDVVAVCGLGPLCCCQHEVLQHMTQGKNRSGAAQKEQVCRPTASLKAADGPPWQLGAPSGRAFKWLEVTDHPHNCGKANASANSLIAVGHCGRGLGSEGLRPRG